MFQSSDEHVFLFESCGPPIRNQKYLDLDKHPLLQEGLHSIIVTTDIQGMQQPRLTLSASMGTVNHYCLVRVGAEFGSTGSAASEYVEGRPIVLDMSSAAVIDPVKELLNDCFLLHAKCPKPSSNQEFQPTRVIDVGVIGNHETSSVRITDKVKPSAYVALSYCWGGPQAVTTTMVTLEDHLRQLPMEKMPQTIKDAITVTRNLGIRYLWVDALCIIQDSDEDKATEISNMGQIYKNATLTIAATCSQSANEGFLWERQPSRGCQVDLLLPNGDLTKMFVSECVLEESKRPLDSRGWAFQESTLSPRLLIYGTMDVSWRCSTKTFETISGGSNERFIPSPRLPNEISVDRSLPEEKIKIQNQAWRSLMIDYTSRSLTFPTDRLSAIAGVTAEFGKLFNDEYLVGMWRKTLKNDLGWYRSNREGEQKCQQLGLGLAPSWS